MKIDGLFGKTYSNLDLLNKKNSLKPELERLNKKINDEKKALASSINSEIKNKSKFKKIITVGTFPATLKKDSISNLKAKLRYFFKVLFFNLKLFIFILSIKFSFNLIPLFKTYKKN